MSVTAYTSSVAAPGAGNHVDKTIDLGANPLPIASVQLYGAGVDSQDGAATWTYAWKILEAPPGGAVTFQDSGTDTSTLQNPVLVNLSIWGNVRVGLIVTNTHVNPARASDDDPDNPGSKLTVLQLPSVSFLQVRLQDAKYGLEKPASGERNWFALYRKLVATVAAMGSAALAAVNQLGLIELEDDALDPAHPKAITQERIKYQGTADGTQTALGFAPGVITTQTGASFCMIWEIEEEVFLETFQVVMQNGGPDVGGGEASYKFEVHSGTKADVENNTMAVLVNGLGTSARLEGQPPVAQGPLVLDSQAQIGVNAGWVLPIRHYVALVCTQAPVSAGRGVSATLNCKRKV